jgi:hypothetical protein
MVALLKQKAKIGTAMKPRKTFEVADVFKRKRLDGGFYENLVNQASHKEEKKKESKIP